MDSLDAIYTQTVTLFNRVPGRDGESCMWIPTVLTGVHLIVDRATSWNNNGGRTQNSVKLNVRFRYSDGTVVIPCKVSDAVCFKTWCEPRQFQELLDHEHSVTFSFGQDDDSDFFVEGEVEESEAPISDANYGRKGFYNHMKVKYDNVFTVNGFHRYALIPHFEITAR